MTKFRREFGGRVREARTNLGWNQTELGEKVGVTAMTISYLETGRHTPTLPRLMKIAKALGVSVGWLVGEVR